MSGVHPSALASQFQPGFSSFAFAQHLVKAQRCGWEATRVFTASFSSRMLADDNRVCYEISPLGCCIYLATTCNSPVIEMCDDTIRISHGFEIGQMLTFIRNSRLIVFCNLKVYDPYFDLVILTGPWSGMVYINKSPYWYGPSPVPPSRWWRARRLPDPFPTNKTTSPMWLARISRIIFSTVGFKSWR